MLKANFKIKKQEKDEENEAKNIVEGPNEERRDITEEELEEYIMKAGAAGSFMVFRSDRKKEDELGLEEL